MADTKIEWAERVWNPIIGCSVISPGCTNCYAMRMAARLEPMGNARYAGLTRHTKAGAVWTGEVRLFKEALTLPLRWKRPRRIFVNSMSDLFHEDVPDEWIDRVFAVMALAPQHTFQVLTKRAERMRAYLTKPGRWAHVDEAMDHFSLDVWNTLDGPERLPLPNVHLGVSVEDQARADERIPHLLATPAAVRWISAEPLLGPVDLRFLQPGDPPVEIDALAGTHGVYRPHGGENASLDWVVVGGESGPGARPMHPDWARSLRDQCAAAGVPFFMKQMSGPRKSAMLPIPEDLAVREYPA